MANVEQVRAALAEFMQRADYTQKQRLSLIHISEPTRRTD